MTTMASNDVGDELVTNVPGSGRMFVISPGLIVAGRPDGFIVHNREGW